MVRERKAPEIDLDDVGSSLAPIFQQAQVTMANHRKNVVSLHKVQLQCSLITETMSKGKGVQLTGEAAFNKAFMGMLNHALPVKKGVSQADKIIKFVAAFVKYSAEKLLETKDPNSAEDEQEETPTSRFIAVLLEHLLRGFTAKDKNVRYRVVQCVAETMSSTPELDEDLFFKLRSSLLERVRDKETAVRVQAVVALAHLQEGDESEKGEQSIVEVLVEVLQFDPSPEVRRAALLNIVPSKHSVDPILSRARDQDNIIRKLLYAHVLTSLPHPKSLSIAQREEVVRNGLKDREDSVRIAAGKLVGKWVDDLQGDLLQLLGLFDLLESQEVAQEALLSAFITRPDLFGSVELGDVYWDDLSPEKSFLARVFVDHCVVSKDSARLESSLPVVTALAFRIQKHYNELLEVAKRIAERGDEEADEEDNEEEEIKAGKEFIVSQLLKIAAHLDYADEIGRRKMYQLIREMISQEGLPESLVSPCLDILRKLSAGERDLIRLVVEVVQELRDLTRVDDPEPEPSMEDDDRTDGGAPPPAPARELSPTTQARQEANDLRSLALCIGMLERVNSTLQDNSVLHGLLPELIIPAVRSKDPLLRERGLMSLGLCCLIDKKIALSSFSLFVQQARAATEDIKKRCLETMFDLLMVYESEFFQAENRIEGLLLEMLDQESPEVQAIACEGVAKLMLSGIVADKTVLRSLVLLYLFPETEDNQALRQCLSYFFPVYCYSSPLNQKRMADVFLETYWRIREHRHELDDDQHMIPASQVNVLFVDWTDPQKAVEVTGQPPDETAQTAMAMNILKALMLQKFPVDPQDASNRRLSIALNKEDKKVLCQLLPRLHIPVDLDQEQALHLKMLTNALSIHRPPKDTVARNAVAKFSKGLDKTLTQQLEGFNENDYNELETMQEKFDWVEEMVADEDSDDEDASVMDTPPHKARKLPRARNPRGQTARAAKKKREEEEDLDEEIDEMLDEAEVGSDEADEVESALSVAGSDEE